jgi:hypothetical protein
MKTATALTLAAVGAILAFAVTAQPSFFSFHIAGWVLMITGLAGAVIPRRGYGWLRRRLVLTAPGNRRREIEVRRPRFSRLLVPGGVITEERIPVPDIAVEPGPPVTSDTAANSDTTVESDIIEQYIEDYEE